MKNPIIILFFIISFLSSCSTPRGIDEPFNKETHEKTCFKVKGECPMAIYRPKRPPCPVESECRTFMVQNPDHRIRNIEALDINGNTILKSKKFLWFGPPQFRLLKLSDSEYLEIDKYVIQYRKKGINGKLRAEAKCNE